MTRPARYRPRLAAFGVASAFALISCVGTGDLPTAAASSLSAAAAGSPTLQVGRISLHKCRLAGRQAYCGSVKVPLDYAHPSGTLIGIYFSWLQAAAGSPRPATIVAQEGGPGYPSTGTAGEYIELFGSLLKTNNLLVVDERGTGRSALINCRPLQELGNLTTTPAFRKAVAACGHQLDHTYHGAGGGFVQASDLFSTANGVRDLKAVLKALQTGPVDLYGDSYGTYFAQSFLSRYPKLLRSVTLDSAYEARGLDPWYVTTVTTARRALNRICQLGAACREATHGTSWGRITKLAKALRRHSVSGTTTGLDGKPVHVVVDQTALVNMVNDAGYDFGPARALDAAVRAYLDGRDKQPLLRLWAQDIGWDDSDYVTRSRNYSDGQYLAVSCTDYPQLFHMRSSEAARRRQFAKSISQLPPKTFAPFTVKEWLSLQPYTENYSGCLTWPTPTHPQDPPLRQGPIDRGHVPVLVLNGALDSLTPPAGGARVARQIGPAARAVVVPNMVHLVGLDDRYGCGASLVRRFIADPTRLQTMSTMCRSAVPEVHAVGSFPLKVKDAVPATGHASITLRRLASVVTAAAGDAAIRYGYVDANEDKGLRGGSIHYQRVGSGIVGASLKGVKWTTDSSIRGDLTFTDYGLSAHGRLVIEAAGRRLTVTVAWNTRGKHAQATVHIGGATLKLPAP